MKAACYLRVSTGQQDVSNQLPAIKAWCESRGYELAEVYQEAESAWRNGHQHELSRLLSDIRGGKRRYDVLLIWSLDRLCRQGIGAVLQLVATFETYGCHVISIQESWTQDTGPMRELFIAMAAWAGKFESDRRSERTKAGLARAIKEGKVLGRPPGRKDSKQRRKKRPVVFKYGGVGTNTNEQ
ncbi:MAG: recombinase family protein [Dehalococcoidales bacterium]|nr:recombinase family protein [Dehalococcoidales bacterium]